MKRDDGAQDSHPTDGPPPSGRGAGRKPYHTPTLVDYGPVAQLTRSLASGTFSDATHMAASMCSGQCQ